MAKFRSGAEAAEFIYSKVIPKVRECARTLSPDMPPKERLAAQIECVMRAFGKK